MNTKTAIKISLIFLWTLWTGACNPAGTVSTADTSYGSSESAAPTPEPPDYPELTGTIGISSDANNKQAPTTDFTSLINDDADQMNISSIEIAITTETVTPNSDLSDETIGNVLDWTDITSSLNGGNSANNHDPGDWSTFQPTEAGLSLDFDGLGDGTIDDLAAGTDYYISIRVTNEDGLTSTVSTTPGSGSTSSAWSFSPLIDGLAPVQSYAENTNFGTWATNTDVLDHIFQVSFITPASMPVSRTLIFESGGSGKGQGLLVDASGYLEFHSGSSTAAGSPRVTSSQPLLPNQQYTVIIFVDNAAGDIFMWVSTLADGSQVNLPVDVEDTTYNQTDHCGTDGGAYGQATNGSTGGVSSGTFAVFPATYTSNLFIYNGRPTGY